jgi:atypical dual specificity phosphatase
MSSSRIKSVAAGLAQRSRAVVFGLGGEGGGFPAHSLLGRFFFWGLLASGVTYALFQKKLLPRPVSKVVSVLFFYPTYPVTFLLRWKNWRTTVDDTLVLGVAPMNVLGHPDHLYKLGVRGVINMCHEYEGPQGAYASLGMRQLRLPTVDHFEPSVENIEEAVKFIKYYKDRGEKVYVHCKAGHGRAACVALCWMLYDDPKLSAKDANAVLCAKRKVRPTLFKQKNVGLFKDKMDKGLFN